MREGLAASTVRVVYDSETIPQLTGYGEACVGFVGRSCTIRLYPRLPGCFPCMDRRFWPSFLTAIRPMLYGGLPLFPVWWYVSSRVDLYSS